MDKEENSSDTENWVIINECDIAEEAITLNKTTDSDHESESSISIISGLPTPVECNSEEELPPNKEPLAELENLSTSTRSSVEKIEISDEDSHIDEPNLSFSPPLIEVTKELDQPLAVEYIINKDNILQADENKRSDSETSLEPKQEPTEERTPPMICPRIIIQNMEKNYESDTDESLPHKPNNVEEHIEEVRNQSLLERDEREINYQTMKYDLPPIADESDSWSDNESSSDYINQDNQLVAYTGTQPHRQDGITNLITHNGLLIGTMFLFVTALLKLYLLNDNADYSTVNTFSYELNKLKEQYQSVNIHDSDVDVGNNDNLDTIVQFCTAKHGSKEDPYHQNHHRVEKCINKRMKKVSNKDGSKKKKITLDMREKLLEIREKELQKREQELIDKLKERYEVNLKEAKKEKDLANIVYKVSENNKRQHRDYFKELRKKIKEDDPKYKKEYKTQDNENEKEIYGKIMTRLVLNNGHNQGLKNEEFSNIDDYNEGIFITVDDNTVEELTEKIQNDEISKHSNNNVVTFKEIALAFREKELVRKLQDYNENLKSRINDIATLPELKPITKMDKSEFPISSAKKDFLKERKSKLSMENYLKQKENNKKYFKKQENIKTKFQSKEKEYSSKEWKNNERRTIFEDKNFKYTTQVVNKIKKDKNFNKKINNENKLNFRLPVIMEPTEKFKNKRHNIIKNFNKFRKNGDYRKKSQVTDELYIKYNPIKDTIDIVNISKSEDKQFILLKNSNKTVNGQWYINLHQARSMLRSKDKSADWYFDRVLQRELKRNKAKWYFDYMSGRQNTGGCFF